MTAVLHDVTVEKTVVLNTVLVVSSTDSEPPLVCVARLLAVLLEVVPPVFLLDDELPLVRMLPLEAVFVEAEPPVALLDDEEPAPEVLTVFDVVDGAGGAALRVLSSAVELTSEDRDLGSSDRHLTLSVEPLLSV